MSENNPIEIWKPVKGYESDYDVSNLGRVRRVSGSRPTILNYRPYRHGYCEVVFKRVGGKRKHYRIHVLVMTAFVGVRPDGMQINHKNGIKTDNRLDNLEWCTQSENTIHRYDVLKKKAAHGEFHYKAKLCNDDVAYIRSAPKTTRNIDLAKTFGVTASNISHVRTGKIWRTT